MKITQSRLKQIIREEIQKELRQEGGFGDMFRQVGRDLVGKLKTAQEMRNEVNKLMNIDPWNDPRSNEFFGSSEHLIGLLEAHGVDWMRPEAGSGSEEIADPGELRRVIEVYKEDPSGQYENFESVMRNLKNALDTYIKGQKL
jgi:hypothetical protein